ncbi:hypothetical protein EZS27_014249 [termite gut metagenome]|uniref:Adenylyl/Guanylyl and SMODS C-terminal sensor domain-containing protein n=1 Tax=termite gut metagenome TaxID=433724 RepID=A0A5J4RUM0_9ZZZZ
MGKTQVFKDFLSNLSIKNKDEISGKYERITKALNQKYYGTQSEVNNSLQVGSYGRKTAVNGVSDLDMIFELPSSVYTKYNNYSGNGQSALLQEIKAVISLTYLRTSIRGDGQVVVVKFSNYLVEVCPVFKQKDNSYLYPDSNGGGCWKKTDPKPEIDEINSFNQETNGNLKNLAKMTRAWKNKCGVKIGGLLIDTLCYEFLEEYEDHQTSSFSNYDTLILDFFAYLKNSDANRKYWYAPGSNQRVYKKKSNFIAKAKKAHSSVKSAIEKESNNTVYSIWRKVFGSPFPYPKLLMEASLNYTSNEEYIEDLYPVDITNILRIDCEVNQAGFRTELLRKMLMKLKVKKKLKFFIEYTDTERPYIVKWKVKNEGAIAKQRNNFRGQILNDNGSETRTENSDFEGEHYVECYLIKDNVCIARDRIDVPISNM